MINMCRGGALNRRIRILPSLLLILLLAACAGNQAPLKAKDYMQGVKGLSYELANQETIITEQDGYSCDTLAQTWVGKRGEDVPTLHPASNDVAIPPQKTNDCIIPFALTLTCGTSDASFVTNIAVAFSSIWREQPGNSWGSNRFIFTDTARIDEAKSRFLRDWEDEKERKAPLSEPSDLWGDINRGVWTPGYIADYKEVEKGTVQTIYGYYILSEYYSPAYPDGNDDRVPSNEDFGVAVSVRVGPNSSNEIAQRAYAFNAAVPEEKYDVFLDFKTRSQ